MVSSTLRKQKEQHFIPRVSTGIERRSDPNTEFRSKERFAAPRIRGRNGKEEEGAVLVYFSFAHKTCIYAASSVASLSLSCLCNVLYL